jgi:hypothetical protein
MAGSRAKQGPGTSSAVSAPPPIVRGTGSRAVATGIADALTRGAEQLAIGLSQAGQKGGSHRIERLRLRLPANASEADIAKALAQAVAAAGRRRSDT